MAITTVEELRDYYASRDARVSQIEPITGGSSNFVWRIKRDPAGDSSIVKHAEPFLAANRDFPFPVDRMGFEVRALTEMPVIIAGNSALGASKEPDESVEAVKLPRILTHDKDNLFLELEDVGALTLADNYADPRLDVHGVAVSIGRWLARLHSNTTSEQIRRGYDHTVARRMYRWNYNSLASVLEKYGFDGSLGERINDKYGALLESDDVCICHSDLWPGNILFRSIEGSHREGSEVRRQEMTVIDWEVTRAGNGVTDVGHFAGELWFLDRFRGERGMFEVFLKAYVGEKGEISREDAVRIAAQFGTHVTFWPTIYRWIEGEQKAQCVTFGNEFLGKVDCLDVSWLRHSALKVLFK